MASILSVGIDIGTSTTQVIFSRIDIDNTAGYFTAPRIAIVGKEILYQGPVYFTPLLSNVLIDGDAVRGIVEREYRAAGYRPEDVDTGAVIITGESARKENAETVLERLSKFAGEFVVSTAGPDLESVVAGKGSGAFAESLNEECTVINLDIGGGTTNVVVFDCGEDKGKTCYDIGGRLIRVSPDNKIEYVSPAAAKIANVVGVQLREGSIVDEKTLMPVVRKMADLLAQAAGLKEQEPLLEAVRTSHSSFLRPPHNKMRVCFSGGVARCYYANEKEEPFQYGDIGVLLAKAIREDACFNKAKVIEAAETIRATVVGAGTHTTSLSGSTICYSFGVFPVKNLPVLKLTSAEQAKCVSGDDAFLSGKIEWFKEQSDGERMLISIRGISDPTYEQIRRLAECIVKAGERSFKESIPIYVAVEEDIAKALGSVMKRMTARKIAVIDSIRTEAGDYVDIGKPVMDGLVVPVIVKTLVFG